ncbi:MAG: hypothetical protein ACKKMP_03255 [Candidatus Nealsonbacteria bacterium]
MNKTIFTIILGVLGIVVLAVPVLASTALSLSPTSINVTQGQNFNQVITINPQGVKNYTVKVELQYPADLLEVRTFTLANNWMALSQQGYDLIDNENGLLIKTAGYPGGISDPITFGIISFSAKQTGSGVIKVGDNSFVLDATNQDVLNDILAQTSVVIALPTSESESKLEPEPILEESEESEEVITETVSTSTQAEEELGDEETLTLIGQTTFLAAIGNILSLGTDNIWVGLFVGIIILAILIYFIQKLRRKKS